MEVSSVAKFIDGEIAFCFNFIIDNSPLIIVIRKPCTHSINWWLEICDNIKEKKKFYFPIGSVFIKGDGYDKIKFQEIGKGYNKKISFSIKEYGDKIISAITHLTNDKNIERYFNRYDLTNITVDINVDDGCIYLPYSITFKFYYGIKEYKYTILEAEDFKAESWKEVNNAIMNKQNKNSL